MRRTLLLTVLIVFVVVVASVMPSHALANNSNPGESLGNKLLDDLDADPADQSPVSPPSGSPSTKNGEVLPSDNVPQPNAVRPAASALIPLARVQQGMQNAQAMLAQPSVDTRAGTVKMANAVQHEVVSELDKLIAQLSKQCQSCNGGQCNKPPQPGECNKPGQPKPGSKPSSATARGKSPARDSNDRLDRSSAQPVEKGEVVDVVKHLWGQLPERSRTQMLQTFSDEFLPKYEQEIQQYYRRLSEEGAAGENRPPAK